jgi:energy-coupling factor transporter ATP-binding protein EcfA2
MSLDSEINWAYTPPSQVPDPPVETKAQSLPFEKLHWEDFEKLCYRLVRLEANVVFCIQYGVPGQEQHGIDIFAKSSGEEKYQVYQCKNEKNFGPAKIKEAVETFVAGEWRNKSGTFILCTRESLRSTERAEEFAEQAKELESQGISLRPWDTEELSSKLKDCPEIVDDFFGRSWVRVFCGEDVAKNLGERLDAKAIKELRTQLRSLYERIFNIHDRGIPLSDVPFVTRYIVPDVEDHQVITPSSELFQKQNVSDSSSVQNEEAKHEMQSKKTKRFYTKRLPVQTWIARNKKNLIFGEPGSGKSAFLRFLALDLLNNAPTFVKIAERWGSHVPIWIPFALWTKTVSDGQTGDFSIKGIFTGWLKSWDAESIIPLVERALKEKRLILLIDGLDEYSNNDAAKIVLNRLESFCMEKDVPVLVTSRPHGFEQIGMKIEGWQQARIAFLDQEQQRKLTEIWFEANSKKTIPALDDAIRSQNIRRQVDAFFIELNRSNELRELARNPLLLCLLISLQISRIRLPLGRFKAYATLTDHLISIHPEVRRIAADKAVFQQELSEEEIKKTLAYLATAMHTDHPEGLMHEQKALEIIEGFLSDDQYGFGMDPRIAKETGKNILAKAEDSLGIIVKRSLNEIGFYHRTIQEYLVSFNISRLPLPNQLDILKKNYANPLWREVILGLFQIIGRPDDVKQYISVIEKNISGPIEEKLAQNLLAEIAFGDFNCPPVIARDIAVQTFNHIEFGTWLPHRENLLKHVLDGLRSTALGELVKQKISCWYPDRAGWSLQYIFHSMSQWRVSEDLIQTLLKGLNAEEYRVKVAAAATLAKVVNHDESIGERLIHLAYNTDDVYITAASIEALMIGWIDHPKLHALIERCINSTMPALKLIGIKGKIKKKVQNENDLGILLTLAVEDSIYYSFRSEIPAMIIEGWPKSERVKQLCLKSLTEWRGGGSERNRNIEREVALKIILNGYPADEEVVDYCIRELKQEKYPFLSLDRDAFSALAQNFKNHPKLIQALDEWVKKVEFQDMEASFAAQVGKTDIFKQKLISGLRNSIPHWSTQALIENWTMKDAEVSKALLDIAEGPASRASRIAHLIPQIVPDYKKCRQILLGLLKDPHCLRYDFVLEGLIRLSNVSKDSEVIDIALPILKLKKDDNFIDGMKAGLIRNYGFDPRVRQLALETLEERNGEYSAVAFAFGNDLEIRAKILEMVNLLPVSMRQTIAKYLSEAEIDETYAMSILRLYDHETSKEVKVQSSIGYHARLKLSGIDPGAELKKLTENITCVGPDYPERRMAAFCGLTVLDRLDLMLNKTEQWGSEKRGASIESILGIDINVPHIQLILKHWEKLKNYFKNEFWERLFRHNSDMSYIYNTLAQFADEYSAPRSEILNYLKTAELKIAKAESLYFLSRVVPGSELLMEYCFNVFNFNLLPSAKVSKDVNYSDKLAAGKIIGENFGGDLEVLKKINMSMKSVMADELVLLLSEGWPQSKELDTVLNELANSKRRCWESTVIRYYCFKRSVRPMYKKFLWLIRYYLAFPKYRAYEGVISPLIRRIQLDDLFTTTLIKHLYITEKSADKVSIAKLIYKSRGLTPDLKQWAEQELRNQLSGKGMGAGLDITTGEFVSLPHVLYEVLQIS